MKEPKQQKQDEPTQDELEDTQDIVVDNKGGVTNPIAALRAELAAERASLAEAQAALTEKDERIGELETNLTSLQENLDANQENLVTLNTAVGEAARKYLDAQRALHPEVPSALITGATIKEVDESVKAGLQVVEAVRATLAAEAKQNRVPAGAPTREVNIDSLSSDEKIKLGLAQQREGGNYR